MKILVLVIITTWSFGSPLPSPQYKIVSSPQDAAITIHYAKQTGVQVEPDKNDYKLYQVDFESKSVTELPIPEVQFK